MNMEKEKGHIIKKAAKVARRILEPAGYKVLPESATIDFYLHKYSSYEQYRDTQILHNKRKLKKVWADKDTLRKIGEKIRELYPDRKIRGLCHGTRNGFEQNFFVDEFGFDMVGTDISDTATQFPNSVQWDFHDRNEDWVGQFDFVYTNSHDQGWNPQQAFTTWLEQIKDDGVLFIEHTKVHGPEHASEMDPFGVRPVAFPYVMCEWFGRKISMEFFKTSKQERNIEAHIFIISKNK